MKYRFVWSEKVTHIEEYSHNDYDELTEEELLKMANDAHWGRSNRKLVTERHEVIEANAKLLCEWYRKQG